MPISIVAYDLKKPGKDYASLLNHLRSFPNCHAQGSVWFIQHNGTTVTLRDSVRAHIDPNDALFVDNVSNVWTGAGMPNCGKWLNDRGL